MKLRKKGQICHFSSVSLALTRFFDDIEDMEGVGDSVTISPFFPGGYIF